MTAFLLEKEPGASEQPGSRSPPPLKKLGYKGRGVDRASCSKGSTPASSVLGGEAASVKDSSTSWARSSSAASTSRLGVGTTRFEEAIGYAQEREAFGKPIAEHQAIQLKLAQMATKIEAARLLTMVRRAERRRRPR